MLGTRNRAKIVQKVVLLLYTMEPCCAILAYSVNGRHLRTRGLQTLQITASYAYIWEIYMPHYLQIESENQKFSPIIFLILIHSACSYKNYCLKCFLEL